MNWLTGDFIDFYNGYRGARKVLAFTANSVFCGVETPELVMGAGAAEKVKRCWPKAPSVFAKIIQCKLGCGGTPGVKPDYYLVGAQIQNAQIMAVQVKRNWKAKGDLELTRESLTRLNNWATKHPETFIFMNCPLIGRGGFTLEQVRPMLDEIFGATNNINITQLKG